MGQNQPSKRVAHSQEAVFFILGYEQPGVGFDSRMEGECLRCVAVLWASEQPSRRG